MIVHIQSQEQIQALTEQRDVVGPDGTVVMPTGVCGAAISISRRYGR